MQQPFNFQKTPFMGVQLYFVLAVIAVFQSAQGQMSTDPRLCGGYQREVRGRIDFKFDDNTAPPGIAMSNKFCMWTISPTVPTEQYRYNITIRNVNLNCDEGDSIAINYFNASSDSTNLGWSDEPNDNEEGQPICMESHLVLERKHVHGTTIVVILYVKNIEHGKGFFMEWEEGYDSRITPSRPRNTYYSFGKPSVAPNPYFAAGFLQNEISTFGFVKANFSTGYLMEMTFRKIECCEGQDDWMNCFDNTYNVYELQESGRLTEKATYLGNNTDTPVITTSNGFFIIVKIEDKFGGGGRFTMFYDTVRG